MPLARQLAKRLSQRLAVRLTLAIGLTLAMASPGGQALAEEPEQDERPTLALMGTIPIYWGEVEGGFDALLSGAVHAHWARAHLEQQYDLAPLDFVTSETLADHRHLLMAQPRGLAPEENLALDTWVREGGRLLLFADPVMTGHSHYPLGDRRRPQDTILLSPILTHWGLDLLFDTNQREGVMMRGNAGASLPVALPVNLAGRFGLRDGRTDCALEAAQILAICAIGKGHAVILADAALLDIETPPEGADTALNALRELAFPSTRENVGSGKLGYEVNDQTSENEYFSGAAADDGEASDPASEPRDDP